MNQEAVTIIYSIYLQINFTFNIYYQPYFEKKALLFDLQLNFYLIFSQFGNIVFIYKPQSNAQEFLALYLILLVPMTYKICNLILRGFEQGMEQYLFKNIAKQKIDLSSAKYLDWFMRKISTEIQTNGRHLTEKQFDKNKIYLNFYIQEMSQSIFQDQQEEGLEKIEQVLNEKNYVDMMIKGVEYIDKKSIISERENLYECIKTLLYFIYIKGKKNNKSLPSEWNISHLVFLLCLKENLQLFVISSIQNSKLISIKEQQILFSLRRELQKKIKLQKYINQEESIYETTLEQIINFDQDIDKVRIQLFEATESKLDILMLMKQKYINLLFLQGKLKNLLQQRKNIADSVKNLVSLNSLNHELYDIYFAYLQTLAFSERDLSLKKYRNYQNTSAFNLRKFIQKSNDESGCVIFASLKNEQSQIIESVSHNFINVFCLQPADIIKKPITNLMTPPFAKVHSEYLKNFFQSNRIASNLKNNLLFAQINNDYIQPVSVDFKINFKMNDQLESEFGISAYIQIIQKDKLYIMYDTTTSRIISMTAQTHIELFSAVQNFHKINLISFFPLLQKTINQSAKRKKNKLNYSNTSLKTSMMSLNMTQTIGEFNENMSQNGQQTQNVPNNIFSQKAQSQLPTSKQSFQMTQKNNVQDNIFNQVLDEQFKQLQQQNIQQNFIHEPKILQNENIYQESAKLDLDNLTQQMNHQVEDIQSIQPDYDVVLSVEQNSKNGLEKDLNNTIKGKKSQYFQKSVNQSTTIFNQHTNKQEDIIDIPYLFLTLNENRISKNIQNSHQRMKQSKKFDNDKQSDRNKSNLEKYNFMIMNITVHTVQSQGLTHLKYIEIQNSKRINPISNANFILNVYKNSTLSGFESNITHIKKAVLRILIGELEQIVKNQLQNSYRSIGYTLNGFREDNYDQFCEDNEEYEQMNELEYPKAIQINRNEDQKGFQIQEKNKNENKILNHLDKKMNHDNSFDNISFSKQNFFQQSDLYNTSLPFDQSRDNSKLNLVNTKQAIALYDLNNSEIKNDNEKYQFDILNKNQIKPENMNDSSQLNNSNFMSIQNPVQTYQAINNTHTFDHEIIKDNKFKQQNQDKFNSLSNRRISESGQISTIQNISAQQNQISLKQQNNKEQQIDSVREIQPQAPRGNYLNSNQEYAKFEIKDNQNEQKNYLNKKDMIVSKKYENSSYVTVQNNQSTLFSPNDKSNIIMTNQFDLMSPQGTNNQILSVKGTHAAYNLMSPQNNSAFNLMSPQNNQTSAKNSFNLNSPKQNNVLPFTKKSNKSKYIATQTNINSATMKQTQAYVNQKSKKDNKNLQDAIESQSNHSKNSSTTSDSKSVRNLILSKKRLGIMNIVDIFGIISFIVIIVVIVQQYIQMVDQFDDFQGDMGVVGWPTQYMNSLSFLVKNVNIQKLLAGDLYIKNGNATISQMQKEAQNQVLYAINSVKNLSDYMEQAPNSRQIFNRIRETSSQFLFGSNYNFSIPLNTQSSSTYYQLKSGDNSLFYSLLMMIVYIFRFGNSLGLGSGQFITLSNKAPLEEALNQISVVSIDEMNNTLDGIQLNLANVLIILLVVIFCCIFISNPIYILIQHKKQQLLQLFGTFNSSTIQKEVNSICDIYFNMNYGSIHNSIMKFVQKSQAAQESEKRQNLSSTSSIEKFNLKILILSIFIFCITLPYPIINQVLSTKFIKESQETLSILETLYQTEQMVIDNTSLNYFCIYLRLHKDPTPYKYSQNREKLKKNIDKSVTLKQQLEDKEKNLKQLDLQSQDLYERFFYKIFESDICQVMKDYTDLFVQGYIYNSDECLTIYNGIFNQGLTVALTKFISVFPDLYLIMEIQNFDEFKQKFNIYQKNLDFEQYYKFERYLAIVLKSLSQFVLNQNSAHELDLKRSLMYLLTYQFIIITLIFYFGWIYFFKIMETELNDTKQYLSILHINFLMQNPYVQNYLYNNLS